MFKLGNQSIMFELVRRSFNADPLVLDLGGNGIDLISMDQTSAWGLPCIPAGSGPDNGMLVLGATGTPTLTEMVGGPGATGFNALASYDQNADGIIDPNDSVYAQLPVWVDTNGDGTVQPGELGTLQQAGVATINIGSTPQSNDTVQGTRSKRSAASPEPYCVTCYRLMSGTAVA